MNINILHNKSNVTVILDPSKYSNPYNWPKESGIYDAYRIYNWNRKKEKLETITTSPTTEIIAVTDAQYKSWKSINLFAVPIKLKIS